MSQLDQFYEWLNVPPNAPARLVSEAYAALVSKYHPHVNPNPAHFGRFRQICVAFRILKKHLGLPDPPAPPQATPETYVMDACVPSARWPGRFTEHSWDRSERQQRPLASVLGSGGVASSGPAALAASAKPAKKAPSAASLPEFGLEEGVKSKSRRKESAGKSAAAVSAAVRNPLVAAKETERRAAQQAHVEASAPGRQLPGPIDSLAVKGIDSSSVDLTWSPPDERGNDPDALQYVLEVRIASTQHRSKTWHLVYEGPSARYEVPNLLSGVQYKFRVRASNFLGNGPLGEPISAVVRGALDKSASVHPEILSNTELKKRRKAARNKRKRKKRHAKKKGDDDEDDEESDDDNQDKKGKNKGKNKKSAKERKKEEAERKKREEEERARQEELAYERYMEERRRALEAEAQQRELERLAERRREEEREKQKLADEAAQGTERKMSKSQRKRERRKRKKEREEQERQAREADRKEKKAQEEKARREREEQARLERKKQEKAKREKEQQEREKAQQEREKAQQEREKAQQEREKAQQEQRRISRIPAAAVHSKEFRPSQSAVEEGARGYVYAPPTPPPHLQEYQPHHQLQHQPEFVRKDVSLGEFLPQQLLAERERAEQQRLEQEQQREAEELARVLEERTRRQQADERARALEQSRLDMQQDVVIPQRVGFGAGFPSFSPVGGTPTPLGVGSPPGLGGLSRAISAPEQQQQPHHPRQHHPHHHQSFFPAFVPPVAPASASAAAVPPPADLPLDLDSFGPATLSRGTSNGGLPTLHNNPGLAFSSAAPAPAADGHPALRSLWGSGGVPSIAAGPPNGNVAGSAPGSGPRSPLQGGLQSGPPGFSGW